MLPSPHTQQICVCCSVKKPVVNEAGNWIMQDSVGGVHSPRLPPVRFNLLLAVINVKRRRWAAEDAKHCNKVTQRPPLATPGTTTACWVAARRSPQRYRHDHRLRVALRPLPCDRQCLDTARLTSTR